MALQQNIDHARSAHFTETLARTADALAHLRKHHADGTLPLLRLPERHDDIATLLGYATLLRDNTTDVIFLGTGGSSLGGQTLAQLAGYAVPGVGALRDPPRIHFMDNLDPESYATLLARLPLKSSRFVAVSKSGGTGETLMQTIAALDAVKALKLKPDEHFLGITEPAKPGKSNGLRTLLGTHQIHMMEHDPGVGGRFSVLTNVGLLPAAVCGLDIGAIRSGAADALAPVLDHNKHPADVPAAVGAALAASLAHDKPIAVMMAYADRLALFTKWYVQLWAESLGKDGKGTTPIGALGPVDQHSQLQLYIAGPRDKLFTVITTSPAGKGPRMTAELSKLGGEPDFSGKTIGDLVAAQ